MIPGPAEYGRLARSKLTGEYVRVADVDGGMVRLVFGAAFGSWKQVAVADFDRAWELLPEPGAFDYRALLAKFLRHIKANDRDYFLVDFYREKSVGPAFTDTEWAELQRLARSEP